MSKGPGSTHIRGDLSECPVVGPGPLQTTEVTLSDYKLTIERVDNGYLLEFPGPYEEDEEVDVYVPPRREVIAEDDGRWGGIEAGQVLIYRIMEFFDLTGSKHDERRIRVFITTPGDEE